ncbi:MAG: undecaprenyl-diphosphate phosphatase [Phycisphaeraceae bacterium]|nr:undecaprenyl-diphosphate phosphatase [Phycisphaeraceae bacterium]
MHWWQAVILGIVEGLTEYLPVSSTGHLLVAQSLLGIGTQGDKAKEAADAYAICIQAGAIVAVLGLYAGRVKQMGMGLLGRDAAGRKLLINLIAAFIPAAVIGLALSKIIKHYLFGTWPVVAAWLVGGLAILAVVQWQKHRRANSYPDMFGQTPDRGRGCSIDQVTLQMAVIIGVMQCLAMWPGTSRSLVTILGGLMVGMSLSAAVEFSFLLGVITLTAATAHDAKESGELMLEMFGPVNLVVGFVVAAFAAALAVKWMVSYLNRHSLAVFGWYRVALAAVAAMLIAGGVMA